MVTQLDGLTLYGKMGLSSASKTQTAQSAKTSTPKTTASAPDATVDVDFHMLKLLVGERRSGMQLSLRTMSPTLMRTSCVK